MFEGERFRVTLEEELGSASRRVEIEAEGHTAVHPDDLVELAERVWRATGGGTPPEAKVERELDSELDALRERIGGDDE